MKVLLSKKQAVSGNDLQKVIIGKQLFVEFQALIITFSVWGWIKRWIRSKAWNTKLLVAESSDIFLGNLYWENFDLQKLLLKTR